MATIKLFDIKDGVVVPTEHCYTIKELKVIMDERPDDYMKIYLYLFYMCCPDKEENPFFNTDALVKEDMIYNSINAEFSLEDEIVLEALDFCEKLYTTVTVRAYVGFKTMLDKVSAYMKVTAISHGRDGNLTAMINAGKNFHALKESFKAVEKDVEEEMQTSHARGGAILSYDQKKKK